MQVIPALRLRYPMTLTMGKRQLINEDFQYKIGDTNKYTPHELGYHQTNRIDFEKGCYTGQEIVARMHYRAKNYHAYLQKV